MGAGPAGALGLGAEPTTLLAAPALCHLRAAAKNASWPRPCWAPRWSRAGPSQSAPGAARSPGTCGRCQEPCQGQLTPVKAG